MRTLFNLRSAVIVSLVLFSGCKQDQTTSTTNEATPTQDVVEEKLIASPSTPKPDVYAFSMLAPGTGSTPVIFARIVYDAVKQTCPTLTGSDGSSLSTQTRPRSPITEGAPATATNFPITVCEAVMQPNTAYSNQSVGISISAVTLKPKHVQVYGDSGCKVSDCGVSAPSTHFQNLANLGATKPHDLILHMGDYNYRGTGAHFAYSKDGHKIYAYDAGDVPDADKKPACTYYDPYYSQNSKNSPKPDTWAYWKADFFDSAKTLLPTSPWVFARGNHELCSRAGVGWFYLLGPGSGLAGSGVSQMQCPDQGDLYKPPSDVSKNIEMIPPYMVELQDFQVWVMDSANACDVRHSNPLTAQYTQQFDQLTAQTANNKPTWVMGHRPVWGLQGDQINNMLQTALAQSKTTKMPTPVSLSLAGHMHIYESLTFFDSANAPTGRPPQIVIGNSGVSLGGAPGNGTENNLDGQIAKYNSALIFGYLQMSVGSNGVWSGQVSDQSGSPIVSCNSSNPANGKLICQ